MSRLAETLDLLGRMVAMPTVSADSNMVMAALVAQRLEDAGARVEWIANADGTKANIWASIGPEEPGGVLLSGHMDVVPATAEDWASDPFAMEEREGRFHGRGTCDMKGFIAAVLAMAPDLAATGRSFHFAFTYDEEVGCLGARQLVGLLRERPVLPKLAIIGEPTEMRVIEGNKGCCEYTTRFTGLAGHGSDPARGVNAVEYAGRYLSRLLELREALKARAPEGGRFEPPWTSVNIGRLTGGVAHNVIPAHAELEWEMRPVTAADLDFVKAEMQTCAAALLREMQAIHPGATIETETIGEVIGLEPMEHNAARDLVARLTGANRADVVAFNTEAGLFQQLGMDAVLCGPGSIEQAHKPDEYVSHAQLEACLDMLAGLAAR